MSYETKALLIAIGIILRMANGDIEKAYNAIAEIANAEGVVLKPYNDDSKNAPKQSNN